MANEMADFCEKHGWKFLHPDDLASDKETSKIVCLLAGGNKSCMDKLSSLSAQLRSFGEPVEVYDLNEILTETKLKELFPGIPSVYQTPAVLHYKNKNLISFIQGPEVVNWSPSE